MKLVRRTFKELAEHVKNQKSKTDLEWDLLDKNINGKENVGKEIKNYVKPRNFWKKDWNR
tara:strand:- start:15004 stop:15183 length:180 start_codon:yes stop_codon:yes gene_type:complete